MITKDDILSEAAKPNKFKVHVELAVPSKAGQGDPDKKVIDSQDFDDKKDAQKFVKDMMKKHGIKKHAGHIVNYKDYKELYTNY